MNAAETELWGVCDTCSRAFFVPSDTLTALDSVVCPVCSEPPTRLEQRSGDAVVDVLLVAPDALI